ncbi:hypothetical protein CN193_21965 [Sinorhizobium meliloti]|jgi:hypothetical protein|uniref:hypothetical protein n=1 Tax=Rhizobium meliloti TaxID=382 RepID=UPI000FDAB3CE|nr:hypothetical protein CN193_21965 [Sinorhizobium meliloti]
MALQTLKIAVQDACERLNGVQTRIFGIINPAVELDWMTAAKDSAEVHAQAAHQSELRRACFGQVSLEGSRRC